VRVGSAEAEGKGRSSPVDHKMALRACTTGASFSAVCRVGTDRTAFGTVPLFATPMAGMVCASRATRDQSIWSASPRRSSKTRCRRSQTPARCQSRRRRQQVMPEPHPISWGSISQGMPLCKTNRMPVRALRSGTRGRPPRGLGGSGGSNGSMTSQSASERRGLAMNRFNLSFNNRFC
jgi:hypothetical protein